jgi:hypothetical protein
LALAVGTLGVLFVGCGGAITARGEVLQPAQVPVRAFPRILIACDDAPESVELATAVAGHLADGRSVVERMEPEAIERLRAAGRIEVATVVLEVRASFAQRDVPHVTPGERFDCGPAGCMDWRRLDSSPLVHVEVRLRVADGPSGRPLQEVELREEETGVDVLGARLRVLGRLGHRINTLLDQRVEEVRVELHPVDREEVRAALAHAVEGRWGEARRALETFVRSSAFRSLPPSTRAHVLFNLGQARRFDTSTPAHQRFASALRALRAAVRLVPDPRFAHALSALEADRRSRAMIRVQQEAMVHNFAIAEQGAAPAAPRHYHD